jgi:hypothetical protein
LFPHEADLHFGLGVHALLSEFFDLGIDVVAAEAIEAGCDVFGGFFDAEFT